MSEYDFWTGAGLVTGSKLFILENGGPKEVTGESAYNAIAAYLPLNSADPNVRPVYLVGRVAMKSKKTDPQKDVVKIFANSTWSPKLLAAFERMEFTKTKDNDPKHLESDVDVDFPANDWHAGGRMELFFDLPGPGKPTAKVTFTNAKQESVSAFWCWPE